MEKEEGLNSFDCELPPLTMTVQYNMRTKYKNQLKAPIYQIDTNRKISNKNIDWTFKLTYAPQQQMTHPKELRVLSVTDN